MRNRFFAAAVAVMAAAGLSGCRPASSVREPPARFVRQIEWAGAGVWLKADTHVHTKFSDGTEDVARVVETAVTNGCDVLAITDHADYNLDTGNPAHLQAIAAARRAHPETIVLAGLEWNLPGWGSAEHATVLVPPGPDEWTALNAFRQRFDDFRKQRHDPALMKEGLKWLAANGASGETPVVIYEHPSRRRAGSMEIVESLRQWRAVNELVIAFSGAPGHQGASPLGSYSYSERVIDRWDPAVARVGDAWDTLLGEGIDLWAAHAPSDFHEPAGHQLNDPWPGEFSETWLYVPERSASGVLRALRAGAFFGAHGHIVRNLELSVEAAGLSRPAIAGEVIEVPAAADVTVRVRFSVPATDWAGGPNRIDAIELIGITAEGATVPANRAPESGPYALRETVSVPAGGLVLRVRGRRTVEDGPDLMFYSNPIRIVTRSMP